MTRIQNGEDALVPELWQSVMRFVRRQAVRYYDRLSAPHCEVEDLYQAGFEAVLYAVKLFDSEKGAGFLTYLEYALHDAFNKAAGYRRTRDAFLRCKSLDEPLSSEDDDTVLADVVEDPSASAAFEDAEERICTEQLHAILEKALDELSDEVSGVLRRVYLDSKPTATVAEEMNEAPERVRQISASGLRGLRRSRYKAELRQFLYDATPSRIGGLRPTETAAILREDVASLRRKW